MAFRFILIHHTVIIKYHIKGITVCITCPPWHSTNLAEAISMKGAFAFSDNKMKNEKMLLVT